MKNEFAFLFPYPKSVLVRDGFMDIRDLCFPLEIFKKYDFLFDHFDVRNKNRGLEISFQERPGLSAEEYALESREKRLLVLANSNRGQFYALATLLQVLSFFGGYGRMPVFSIRDKPEIAMRGFALAAAGAPFPLADELERLLLKLALLRFNCIALPGACGAKAAAIAARARKMGMEILLLPASAPAAPGQCFGHASPEFFSAGPVFIESGTDGGEASPTAWFEYFLDCCRQGQARGSKVLAWADRFWEHADWIRKIPHEALLLNRVTALGKPDFFQDRVRLLKKYHVRQILCPTIWNRDRFIPAVRSSMGDIRAAFSAAKAEKLAGVMLIGGESGGYGCLPEGNALLLFETGCLLWSGRPAVPEAFSHWALGRTEPDLFRVFSFLAQVDQQLPQTHCQYLFEDPVFAAFSRSGNPRKIEAHYRKAALYLKKRKIAHNELSDFLGFSQQFCEFIAAKVEFSSRLCPLLEEKGGPEQIHCQASALGQGAAKLKSLYLELWRKRFQSEGDPEFIGGFSFLQERFQYLRQASSRPAAQKSLLLELKNFSPSVGQDPLDGDSGRER